LPCHSPTETGNYTRSGDVEVVEGPTPPPPPPHFLHTCELQRERATVNVFISRHSHPASTSRDDARSLGANPPIQEFRLIQPRLLCRRLP